MQNSFKKYFEAPVVQEQSLSTIDNTRQPTIYVCQADQFNDTAAFENGYPGRTTFTIGKLEGHQEMTWRGKYGNSTFEDIFNTDYSNFYSKHSNLEHLFLPQHGFCKKMLKKRSDIYIKTHKRSMILIVDPYLDSGFYVVEVNSGRLYFGPTYDNYFDSSSFNLKYMYHDNKIADGQSCTDYEMIESSYGTCIENIMKKYLLECYGCLPTWFPKEKGLTCEIEKDVNDFNEEYCVELNSIFTSFMLGKNLMMFEECLPPCLKMSIEIKRTYYHANILNHAKLSIVIENEVVVEKATHSYDIFNLVVDIGSALGLWLGLSALCILDNIIKFCSWMLERKCGKCKSCKLTLVAEVPGMLTNDNINI